MKQKIEWYREVLDLEPGSRVFFPLAKLLAANGQTSDAISTLRQGLLRHPDNVEARLLLVELLYLQDDDAGVQSEISHLGGTFSLYPVFWKAWSDKLSENPESHDASLALRFFAAALQGKTVNWADVVVQGLRAVLRDAENSPAPRKAASGARMEGAPEFSGKADVLTSDADIDETAAQTLAEMGPAASPAMDSGLPADLSAATSDALSDALAEDLAPEDADLSPDDLMPDAFETPPQAVSSDAFAPDGCEDLSPDDELTAEGASAEASTGTMASGDEIDLSPDDLDMDFPAESASEADLQAPIPSDALTSDALAPEAVASEAVAMESLPEAMSGEGDAILADEVQSEPAQPDIPLEEAPSAFDAQELAAQSAASSQEAGMDEEGDESSSDDEEEAFSLRTRSMAEVLAEQGDIAGALDIYQELLAASSDEERPALAERAEELQQRLESPASSEHKAEERAVQPGTESSRLVNLLESLAQRLEDRAR